MNKIEVFPTDNGQWAFRFVAANGEIVATSETYERPGQAMETAVLVSDGFVDAELVLLKENNRG